MPAAVIGTVDFSAVAGLGAFCVGGLIFIGQNVQTFQAKKAAKTAASEAADTKTVAVQSKETLDQVRTTQLERAAGAGGKYEELVAHNEQQVAVGVEQNVRMFDLHEATNRLLATATEQLVKCEDQRAEMAAQVSGLELKVADLKREVSDLRSQIAARPSADG